MFGGPGRTEERTGERPFLRTKAKRAAFFRDFHFDEISLVISFEICF